MNTYQSGDHVSDELLEEYARGSLSTSQASAVGEHLIDCDECGERLNEEVEFTIACREAARRVETSTPAREAWWMGILSPAPAVALASALGLAAFFLPRITQTSSPAVAELTAIRGSMEADGAPAGRPLDLRLAGSGTEELKDVRVEIVNSDGGRVWTGAALKTEAGWRVRTGQGLSAGRYWVRLFEARAAGSADPLREYPLLVR